MKVQFLQGMRYVSITHWPNQPNPHHVGWVGFYICNGLGLVRNFSTQQIWAELKKPSSLIHAHTVI